MKLWTGVDIQRHAEPKPSLCVCVCKKIYIYILISLSKINAPQLPLRIDFETCWNLRWRYNWNPTSPWIHPISWTLPGLAPQKLEGSTSYKKWQANAKVSRLQPETIRKSSNSETQVAKVLQMTNPLTIVGSIVIQTNVSQTINCFSDPSVFYPYMDVDEELYEFESHVRCWSSRLPDTIQSNTRTSMKGLSIKYAVAWPPQGSLFMDKDELGLCCKYTKQLRSAPIFVKSSNSSTIMQYTDINRYRRIILVSAMFTNIISFLAAATRAMPIALLLLSVISQDSPMQHSTDQKRTRHSRCMCIYTHYIAYVIQTQSYA